MRGTSKIIRNISINKSSPNHQETKIQIMIIQTKSTANPKEHPSTLIITSRIIRSELPRATKCSSRVCLMLMRAVHHHRRRPRRASRVAWPLSPIQPPQTLK